jgi:hypothetical protein
VTRRPRTWTAAALAAAVVLGTVYSLPRGPFTGPAPAWTPTGAEVRGVFHIHTRRSDGTGSIDDVASAAARAGLQFVIVTDHGDGTRTPDRPEYRSGVLCIDAVEISTDGGHYAALGLGPTPYPLGGEPGDVAEDVRRLGGFGVATHPLSPKAGLAWRDWKVRVDAIEWLNGDSLWRDVPTSRLVRDAWTYLLRPVSSIARLYQRPATLTRWDTMDRGWRVVGLAGTDAHARLGFRDTPEPYESHVYLEVPSYRVAFAVASLRIRLAQPLGGRADADAAAVLGAIREGRVHTVVDGLGRKAAFEFTASSGGVTAAEGGHVALTDPAVIRVRSNPPPDGWVVLFRDGMQVHRVRDQELVYASDQPGTYRAEVWAPAVGRGGFVPWIVGNPIVVGPEARPAAPSAPDAGGPPSWLRADQDIWRVEHDPGSRAAVTREAGVGLSYALGSAGAVARYAALVVDTLVEPGGTGVAFVGRADRPMRVSVQLRVPTAGDGLRWRRSIYLEPNPREVFIPFSETVAVGDTPPGPPRLSDVRAVLFVVDLVNAVAGSSGHFELKDVRFYAPRAAAATAAK